MWCAGITLEVPEVTRRVFQTEARFVAFSHLLPRGSIQQVIVAELIHTVVMPGEWRRIAYKKPSSAARRFSYEKISTTSSEKWIYGWLSEGGPTFLLIPEALVSIFDLRCKAVFWDKILEVLLRRGVLQLLLRSLSSGQLSSLRGQMNQKGKCTNYSKYQDVMGCGEEVDPQERGDELQKRNRQLSPDILCLRKRGKTVPP